MVTCGRVLRCSIHHHTIYENKGLICRLYQLLDILDVGTLDLRRLKLSHHLSLGCVLELNNILLEVEALILAIRCPYKPFSIKGGLHIY